MYSAVSVLNPSISSSTGIIVGIIGGLALSSLCQKDVENAKNAKSSIKIVIALVLLLLAIAGIFIWTTSSNYNSSAYHNLSIYVSQDVAGGFQRIPVEVVASPNLPWGRQEIAVRIEPLDPPESHEPRSRAVHPATRYTDVLFMRGSRSSHIVFSAGFNFSRYGLYEIHVSANGRPICEPILIAGTR